MNRSDLARVSDMLNDIYKKGLSETEIPKTERADFLVSGLIQRFETEGHKVTVNSIWIAYAKLPQDVRDRLGFVQSTIEGAYRRVRKSGATASNDALSPTDAGGKSTGAAKATPSRERKSKAPESQEAVAASSAHQAAPLFDHQPAADLTSGPAGMTNLRNI